MQLPSMNALRAFEAAARHCSFKRAGEELNVTPGAISRFVKLLEADLGVQLFERLPNGLRLTEMGQGLYPKLTRALGNIEKAISQTRGARSEIKMVLPATIASRLLVDKVSAFNAATAGPRIRYSIGPQDLDDCLHGEFDLGVCYLRSSERRPPELAFRFLRSESLAPLCSPALLTGEPPLRRPDDLTKFDLLHPYHDKDDWKAWLEAAEVETVDPAGGQVFMTMEMAVRAAIQGHGVAIGDLTLFGEEIGKGELVAPFDAIRTDKVGYFIFGKPDRLDEPQISAFCDWLVEEVAG